MNSTTTIYNGSVACACGKILTPLEAMYGTLCQDCRAAAMRQLISSGMVDPGK